ASAAPAEPAAAAPGDAARKPRLTPLARRIAAAMQLDLARLGNGRAGLVRKADILAMAEEPRTENPEPIGADQRVGPEPVEANLVLAHATSRGLKSALPKPLTSHFSPLTSQFRIPVATSTVQVDMGAVVAYCTRHRTEYERRRLRLDELACIAYAAIATLPAQPLLNARWSDDGVVLRRRLHLLLADVLVPDASDLTLRGLVRQSQSMQQGEPAAATFSIHPGSGHMGAAHLPHGQSAALLLGTTRRQAVVIDDAVAVRPVLLITLAYDGRVLTQAHAGHFLSSLRQQLEHFT
nr:2-oxo acid dehydrogenase subunit E2 [Chloroflexaceae bacterium]